MHADLATWAQQQSPPGIGDLGVEVFRNAIVPDDVIDELISNWPFSKAAPNEAMMFAQSTKSNTM